MSLITKFALAHLSSGFCYWPKCRVPIISWEGDEPYVNVETAHIRAASFNGPRYAAAARLESINPENWG